MKLFSLILVSLLFVSCAKNAPPGLTVTGIKTWQANQVAVGLGVVQHAAIQLNQIQVCDPINPATADPVPCHLLLSDNNTRIVVDAVADGVNSLRAVPDGWKATGLAVIDRIGSRLDAGGLDKLSAYLAAARAVIESLVS